MKNLLSPVTLFTAAFAVCVFFNSCAESLAEFPNSKKSEEMITINSSDLIAIESDINSFTNQLAEALYQNFDFNFTVNRTDVQTKSSNDGVLFVLNFQSEGNEPFQVVCNLTSEGNVEYSIVQADSIIHTVIPQVLYTEDGYAIIKLAEAGCENTRAMAPDTTWGDCFTENCGRPFMVALEMGAMFSNTCRVVCAAFAGVFALGCLG